MRRLLILILLVAGVQVRAQAPFEGGEELVYSVAYRAALIPNINLMRVTLRTIEEEGGRYHVIGNGRTGGAVKGIFDLNDTYHAWLDGKTLLPEKMTSDLHENDYKLRATYTYDWEARTVSTIVRKATWTADRYTVMKLAEGKESGDALSLLYRLRAMDVGKMVVGRPVGLELVLNEVTKPIEYTYWGREEVKVRKMGKVRALKFTCTMATSDGSEYEEGMTLTVWVSDDARKVPLLVECPVRVGRVTVTLNN